MTYLHAPFQHRQRPLILIVDDVAENRSIVQRRLDRMGFDCVVADSGAAALNMIRAMSPHLVLLDYMMPDMDGPMVLREIRASSAYAKLPVIMLTARTDGASIASALDDGADDYVLKPIDFSVLKARIETRLFQYDAARSLIEANSRLDARAAAQAVELGAVRELLRDRFKSSEALSGIEQVIQALERLVQTCSSLTSIDDVDRARIIGHEAFEELNVLLQRLRGAIYQGRESSQE